jgi:hypothetical protein
MRSVIIQVIPKLEGARAAADAVPDAECCDLYSQALARHQATGPGTLI